MSTERLTAMQQQDTHILRKTVFLTRDLIYKEHLHDGVISRKPHEPTI